MYCKNCGNQIDDDSKYCNYCGTEQSINTRSEPKEEPKKIDVNLKISGPKINFAKPRNQSGKQKIENYDETYKKETDATLVGVIILVANLVLLIADFQIDQKTYAILSIISLILRIAFTVWVVNIAKRQNRPATGWGFLGFFFPSIALIIIGQLKKIKGTDQKTSNTETRRFSSSNVQKTENYTEDYNELFELKRNLMPDEIIIMQREDKIYSSIKKEDWEKAKEKGADQEFEVIEN